MSPCGGNREFKEMQLQVRVENGLLNETWFKFLMRKI
jgi:hypothetical protein